MQPFDMQSILQSCIQKLERAIYFPSGDEQQEEQGEGACEVENIERIFDFPFNKNGSRSTPLA